MFGVLIVEDLIAILLIAVLTALSSGEEPVGAVELAMARAAAWRCSCAAVVVGLLVVPRAVRDVVASRRSETTVVASVGLAFGFALLAVAFGYSVALGAFLAGSLVSESGVEQTIEHLVAAGARRASPRCSSSRSAC